MDIYAVSHNSNFKSIGFDITNVLTEGTMIDSSPFYVPMIRKNNEDY